VTAATVLLGRLEIPEGHYDRAQTVLAESMTMSNAWGMAEDEIILAHQGNLARIRGELDRAERLLGQALDYALLNDDTMRVAVSMMYLALLAARKGEHT